MCEIFLLCVVKRFFYIVPWSLMTCRVSSKVTDDVYFNAKDDIISEIIMNLGIHVSVKKDPRNYLQEILLVTQEILLVNQEILLVTQEILR